MDGDVFSIGGPAGELLKVKIENEEEFRDDLTGQLLNPSLVREARAKEMLVCEVERAMD